MSRANGAQVVITIAVVLQMVMLAALAIMSFYQMVPERAVTSGVALSQGLLTAMLLMVTFAQANISAKQADMQAASLKRSGAIVEAHQVPCITIGGLPLPMVAGIEVWNAGQQATEIRDAYFESNGSREDARIFWHHGGPSKDIEMDLETRILEPGKMWQLRISPRQPVMSGRNPRFVIVPVLGEPAVVSLTDPTMLDGPYRF